MPRAQMNTINSYLIVIEMVVEQIEQYWVNLTIFD